MNIVQWNPFREYDDLFTRTNSAYQPATASSGWVPAVDIVENEDAFGIEIEVPAMSAKDVKVEVKEGVLTVSGDRVQDETDRKTHRRERRFGAFSRSFQLPESVKEDKISAKAKDGVLYLVVPKREEVLPKSIEVKVH